MTQDKDDPGVLLIDPFEHIFVFDGEDLEDILFVHGHEMDHFDIGEDVLNEDFPDKGFEGPSFFGKVQVGFFDVVDGEPFVP